MKRNDAVPNAMTVVFYAMTFYQDEVVTLSNHIPYEIYVTIHLPTSKYIAEREQEKISHLVLAGAKIEIREQPEYKTVVIAITWPIDE